MKRSLFYSFKPHILIGEIDYVKTYQEDYKNKTIRDWIAGSLVVREKEASLLLSQRERIDNHLPVRKRQRQDW
jgi:hypothetical protein